MGEENFNIFYREESIHVACVKEEDIAKKIYEKLGKEKTWMFYGVCYIYMSLFSFQLLDVYINGEFFMTLPSTWIQSTYKLFSGV